MWEEGAVRRPVLVRVRWVATRRSGMSLGGDVAGDLLMAAGGAGILKDSFGVSRIDPD
jgi:hypothetical protein